MKYGFLTLVLLFSACSSSAFRARSKCFTPDEVTRGTELGEHLVDIDAELDMAPQGYSKQIVDRCFAKVFTRRGYRWAISGNPDDIFLFDSVWSRKEKPRETDNATCLNRAVQAVENLNNPVFTQIIHDYRERFKDIWTDSDYGPLQFLSCEKSDSDAATEYPNLLASLNRQFNHGQCFHIPGQSELICSFWGPVATFSSDLYPKLDPAAFPNKDDKKVILKIQFLMSKGGLDPKFLMDFIIQNSVMSEVLTTLKDRQVLKFDAAKDNRAFAIPFFANFLFKYLETLKTKFPYEYNGFYRNDEGRNGLLKVSAFAEEAFNRWLDLLKANGTLPAPETMKLWDEYKESKARLQL